MEIIIEDMEHRVRKIIYEHSQDPGFPRLEDYGVTEDEFAETICSISKLSSTMQNLFERNTPFTPSSSSSHSSWLLSVRRRRPMR